MLDPALIIQQALEARWPEGAGPEARVRRAAAEFLLTSPAGTAVKAVLIASHVSTTVGKVSALGINQKFEQVLAADPCFILDRQPANTLVTLNTAELLSSPSYRADQQPHQDQQQQQVPQWQPHHQQQSPQGPQWQSHNQQQQQLQPGSSLQAATSGSGGAGYQLRPTRRLLQGLQELWPLTGLSATPESKIKHAALMHLLHAPNHSAELSQLAAAVDAALAPIMHMNGPMSLPEVLGQERSVFVFRRSTHPPPGSLNVALNGRGVLGMFVHKQGPAQLPPQEQQQQQQQQEWVALPGEGSTPPPQQQQAVGGAVQAAAAPESSSVSASALLQFVRRRCWHAASPVLDAARRSLAERLILKVNTGAATDAQLPAKAEAKWYTMLGSMAGYTIAQALEGLAPAAGSLSPPSLEDCVDGDPYLSIHCTGEVQHIRLDIEQLLQDAAAALAATTYARFQQQLQQRVAPGSSKLAAGAAAGRVAAGDASSSAAHVAAAARGGRQVTVAALLQLISSRVWHGSNQQLDLARRTLAQHLVTKANAGSASNCLATPDAAAYRDNFARAGILINKELKDQFGPDAGSCYSKFADVFAGDPCWTVIPNSKPGGQLHVQLNLPQLLQEAAAGVHTGSSSNSRPGVQAGGAAAAPAARPDSGTRPAPVRTSPAAAAALAAPAPAASPAGGAAAAEQAMAAIKAAARSLIPPAVKSPAASAAAVGAAPQGSSTLVAATSAGPSSAGVAAAGAAGQPQPFLPIWLQGIGSTAQATAHPQAQQQQQGEGSVLEAAQLLPGAAAEQGLSVSSDSDGSWLTSPLGSPQQHGRTTFFTPAAAAQAGAAPSSSHMEQPEPVPLQYELLLSNSVPGWYTASYALCDDAAGSAAAHAAGGSTGPLGAAAAGGCVDSPVAAHRAAPSSPAGVQLPASPGMVAAAANGAAEHTCSSCSGPAAGGPGGSHHQAAAAAAAAAGGGVGAEEAAQRPDADLQVLLQAIPDRLRAQLQPYLARAAAAAAAGGSDQPQVTSIIIDAGQPVTLRFSDRTSVQLSTDVTLSDTLGHLIAVQQQWAEQQQQQQQHGAATARDPQQNGVTDSSSSSKAAGAGGSASIHANGSLPAQVDSSTPAASSSQGATQQGLSAAAGHFQGDVHAAACQLFGPGLSSCLGVPGSCHRVCAVQDAAGRVAGLTYCLQRAVPGAAASLADVLSGMKASLMVEAGLDRPRSLLVLGRPGSPKTCLLRDICRLMSSSHSQGGLGLHVMLLDTTGRIAGLHAQPTPHIGAARVIPVPDRAQQAHTMARIARSHAPDVLVVGELATQQEAAAAVHITRSCNVLLVAAAPACSLRMLLQDSTLCQLVGCERAGRAGVQRALPSPFSIAVELLGRDRCCLDTDLQASSDDLMLQLSNSNKKKQQGGGQQAKGSPAVPDVHAQIRSTDAHGRLLVQFGSAAAAGSALADAAIVEVIAQDSAGR